MPNGNAGPELTPVGDELVTPEAASELERAASALETMTKEVQGLMSELKKEQDPPLISLETEKASTAAATLREVGERAMSLAKALEAAKEPDMGKLSKEVGALVKLLQGIAEKYPYPKPKAAAKSDDPPEDPAPGEGDPPADPPPADPAPEISFATVAEKSLGMAAALAGAKTLSDEIRTGISDVAKSLTDLAGQLKVEKAEVEFELPEVFSAEEPEDMAVIKAMEGIFRDVTNRINTVAKMDVSDAVKKEVNLLQAIVAKAVAGIPTKTTKASKHLTQTLKDVAGRALTLSQKAEKVDDAKLVREMKNLSGMIEALVEKYSGVKKAEDFELSDLGQILSADRMLSELEAQLAKLETPAPTDPPPAADPPPAEGDNGLNDLTTKITALGEQLKEITAAVAKARDNVQPPASGGQDPDPGAGGGGGNGHADIIFPQDYNDPEYHEALKKRGIE